MGPQFYSLYMLLTVATPGVGFTMAPSLYQLELAEQIGDENNA